jgi:hypothetical protein
MSAAISQGAIKRWREEPALMRAPTTFQMLRPEFARPALDEFAKLTG